MGAQQVWSRLHGMMNASNMWPLQHQECSALIGVSCLQWLLRAQAAEAMPPGLRLRCRAQQCPTQLVLFWQLEPLQVSSCVVLETPGLAADETRQSSCNAVGMSPAAFAASSPQEQSFIMVRDAVACIAGPYCCCPHNASMQCPCCADQA